MIDIGKMLLAQKKLKEPSNNREVFLILQENQMFPSKLIPLVDKMIGMRNVIVHSYDRINDGIVYGVLKRNLRDIEKLTAILKKACLVKK